MSASGDRCGERSFGDISHLYLYRNQFVALKVRDVDKNLCKLQEVGVEYVDCGNLRIFYRGEIKSTRRIREVTGVACGEACSTNLIGYALLGSKTLEVVCTSGGIRHKWKGLSGELVDDRKLG